MTVTTAQYGEITTSAIQVKPWGHEVVFATGENDYVGKIITVHAGQALSLQYHDRKDETIRVMSGEATLEHGPSADRLTHAGDAPGRHRPPGADGGAPPHGRHGHGVRRGVDRRAGLARRRRAAVGSLRTIGHQRTVGGGRVPTLTPWSTGTR